jgi:hypothetical protein
MIQSQSGCYVGDFESPIIFGYPQHVSYLIPYFKLYYTNSII